MYHYEYVNKDEWSPIKQELVALIKEVQNELRDEFTFQFQFVGSSARNMITCDFTQNQGFDFDVNIILNHKSEHLNAKEIKYKLMNAFNSTVNKPIGNIYFGYDYCEDSTRVFTIKVKDNWKSKILYSADFCIVRKRKSKQGEQQEYIRHNKETQLCQWQKQPKGFYKLEERETAIKEKGLWNEVRNIYLYKKNNNTDNEKKSRSLYAEAINEVHNQL